MKIIINLLSTEFAHSLVSVKRCSQKPFLPAKPFWMFFKIHIRCISQQNLTLEGFCVLGY